jgi:hypothetical protein
VRSPIDPRRLPHARATPVASKPVASKPVASDPLPAHRPTRAVPAIAIPDSSSASAFTRALLFAPAVLGALLLLLVATPLILVPGALQFKFGQARSPLLAVGLSLLGGEAVLLLLFHPLAG